MNKTPRLSKSGIEYLTHTWGFYSGCHNAENGICPVGKDCWARKITQRFPSHYPNGFEPTFYPEAFLSPLHLKKPSIIGCAFMGDLFLDEIDPKKSFSKAVYSIEYGWENHLFTFEGYYQLRDIIFSVILACPQHKFLFLTKCPWNLIKWSPFPENCWVGVTVTNREQAYRARNFLLEIKATVKYLSLEPLLGHMDGWALENVIRLANWLIIGAQTNPYRPPKIEQVEEIVEVADKAEIPVFLKDNLKPLLATRECLGGKYVPMPLGNEYGELKQEMPI